VATLVDGLQGIGVWRWQSAGSPADLDGERGRILVHRTSPAGAAKLQPRRFALGPCESARVDRRGFTAHNLRWITALRGRP
jgi:hypothetical protein